MTRKEKLIISILVMVIIIFTALIIYELGDNDTTDRQVLANDSRRGSVEVIRNIGNPEGKKIAYVVGVHPLEHLTHETLTRELLNATDLNQSYDLYIINVTQGVGAYDENYSNQNNQGRDNGQYLAYEYVYPQIANGGYDLAVDVHSNIGAYPYRTFVFSPLGEGLAADYASQIAESAENISCYSPESTTSGPYLTIPLNQNGVPAFYFEEYSFAPQDLMGMHVRELIGEVDKLFI